MSEVIGTVVLNFLLLLGLWWLVFVELRSYRLDLTRQKLFNIRDELFALAAKGEMAFDSKAYGLMRTTLNGMIRFAHKISLIRLIATIYADEIILKGKGSAAFDKAMSRAISELPFGARKKILAARKEMHRAVLRHIVFSSVILTILFVFAMTLRITQLIGRLLLTGRQTKEPWSAIDAEAEHIGAQEQDCPRTLKV